MLHSFHSASLLISQSTQLPPSSFTPPHSIPHLTPSKPSTSTSHTCSIPGITSVPPQVTARCPSDMKKYEEKKDIEAFEIARKFRSFSRCELTPDSSGVALSTSVRRPSDMTLPRHTEPLPGHANHVPPLRCFTRRTTRATASPALHIGGLKTHASQRPSKGCPARSALSSRSCLSACDAPGVSGWMSGDAAVTLQTGGGCSTPLQYVPCIAVAKQPCEHSE
ncbi:hypothetical protein O3P69_004794 [Scylla paramamosain]|uniref:Uncharacterized protein n=1 Tax=Scylla paramamosain TaxID=85552 RepID=A0AAW0UB42_SCYPA